MRTTRSRSMYLFLAIPLLVAAKGDGKGCCGKKPPPDTDTHVVDTTPVEKKLQVAAIEPATGKPNTSFSARVYGAAFADGATVSFGTAAGSDVRVQDDNTIQVTVPALSAGSYDVVVTNPDGTSARLRQGLTIRNDSNCSFVRVNFDFDSSSIPQDGKATLDANMACMQGATGKISVEGHCDERGTTEYNLALGQRRADAVKRYLSTGGVAGSRISTVSYGEEKPVANGHDESAWSQNRRADIYVAE